MKKQFNFLFYGPHQQIFTIQVPQFEMNINLFLGCEQALLYTACVFIHTMTGQEKIN